MTQPPLLPSAAREAMEALNNEAAGCHIWLRTQANAPAQQAWFKPSNVADMGTLASGRVAAGQLKALPHHWQWTQISPYLEKIAAIARDSDIPPIEFADRQQFLLTNPGFGGRLQAVNSIRCAVSIYNKGDVAPVHVHSPNASRTILSEKGGYTTIEGERCPAERGDILLTPNGTWHDHGNDEDESVVWMDVLDWPLLEFLDCIWLDDDYSEEGVPAQLQTPRYPMGYSGKLYGSGGILPTFTPPSRGHSINTSPMLHYRGQEIRRALDAMTGLEGDPAEGIHSRLVNPVTGGSLFPTLDYCAQLLRKGEQTQWKRETSSTVYLVMDGHGTTEVGTKTYQWQPNDIIAVPNFLWRRHKASTDAVLYSISDRALLQKIGQYQFQTRER